MLKLKWIFLVLILVIAALSVYFVFFAPSSTISPSQTTSPAPTTSTQAFADPIADFKPRINKKPFGIYITPQTSPVQPERFTGYHTGVDVEYQDVTTDIPVFAISDGVITYSNWVSGYGGVFIIKVDIDGKPHSVLYGHVRPSALPGVGQNFKKGDKIAVLGTGYSHETDGERRHLHFTILSDSRIDLKGYVQNKSQLSGWIDPLSFYK